MDDKIDLRIFVHIARPLGALLETEFVHGNAIAEAEYIGACIHVTMTHPVSENARSISWKDVTIRELTGPSRALEFMHSSGHLVVFPISD